MEAEKKAMADAEAEEAKNNWAMGIDIVDTGGHLVMLHRLDNTQIGSVRVAEGKARTSAEFRLPTKAVEDSAGIGRCGRLPLPTLWFVVSLLVVAIIPAGIGSLPYGWCGASVPEV